MEKIPTFCPRHLRILGSPVQGIVPEHAKPWMLGNVPTLPEGEDHNQDQNTTSQSESEILWSGSDDDNLSETY